MLNIQKSKNTVLISNISIITFLNLALYTRAASLLASRGLEAVLHEAETKTHEAEASFFGLEAEARPRGLTSLAVNEGQMTGHICRSKAKWGQ